MKQISALYAWAIKNDLATFNPAEKLERLGGRADGYYTWTDQDVEAFGACWPIGSKPRLAMSIMLYLGVRPSDATLIGKKHESKDGQEVTFQVFKGRKRGANVLTLPILPPFRAILNASVLGAVTWLETSLGKSPALLASATRSRIGVKRLVCRIVAATAFAKLAPFVPQKPVQANMSLWPCSAGKMPTWHASTRARRRRRNWLQAAPRSSPIPVLLSHQEKKEA